MIKEGDKERGRQICTSLIDDVDFSEESHKCILIIVHSGVMTRNCFENVFDILFFNKC